MMSYVAERVEFEELDEEAQFPVVYAVVNRLEEGDHLLQIFNDSQLAFDYACMEAELNELDLYVIIERELIQID
jgi:hypothetical protein